MNRRIITTEWLVDVLRSASIDNPYTHLIKIPQDKEIEFVIDLMHSALQSLFASQERISDYDYEVLISRYVDKHELFHAAKADYGFMEEVTEIPYYDEVSETEKIKEIRTPPSNYDMCAAVFDDLHTQFVETFYDFIRADTTTGWSKVRLLTVNPNESFLLEISGDIRTDVFKELFGGQRFDESKFNRIKAFLDSEKESADD